jgi:hypothetical protein
MDQLAELSARITVMSHRGHEFLRDIYKVPDEKIDLIPHGIPDLPFVDSNFYKDRFGVEGKNVLLTFGLLSPSKGIEHALHALPAILKEFPDTVYIVLGATHPKLLQEQGETYRFRLERITQDLGIKKNVIFYNRFVALRELVEFIGAADIYVTPYLNESQITSGTLAYAFGCGKAVVSTPYWHAEELLADGRGVLVPFGDSDAIAREVCALLHDDTRRHAMRKRAYLLGREMIWPNVAHLYMESFQRARREYGAVARRRPVIRTLDERRLELPWVRLEHLWRMTDSTGLFQHATYTIPNFREGYCTDDNARALVLMVLLEELGQDSPESERASGTYAAFLDYAFDREKNRFHNFLSFDRRWLDEVGSDDCLGRSVWALGACLGRSKHHGLQAWAVNHFERALNAVLETTSPRCWAYALIGIHEYLRRLSGDRLVNQARDMLTSRLIDLYHTHAADDWPWFEDVVSYANARLPHALILSGQWTDCKEASEIGLKSLRWLCNVQHSPKGCFRPVGCHGFYRRGEVPATFDQQPIEACATVSACVAAYQASDEAEWLNEARLAFEWFLGRNDLGLPLWDSRTGACCDGLSQDRPNQNQGAESTLSVLLALVEMQLLEASLAAFGRATEPNGAPARQLVRAVE